MVHLDILKLLVLVDDTDKSITSNITTVNLSKRVTPNLNVGTKYIIPFGNALFNPHEGHMSGYWWYCKFNWFLYFW